MCSVQYPPFQFAPAELGRPNFRAMVRGFRTRPPSSWRSRDASPPTRPTNSSAHARRSLGLPAASKFFSRRTTSGPVDSGHVLTSATPAPSTVCRQFDPLELVRRLPTRVAAPCFVKSARHLAVFTRFERYWLELRGRLVVMLLLDNVWTSTHRRTDTRLDDHSPSKNAVIEFVFSVERCLVLRPRPKAPVLKISNPSHPHHVWLRFDNDADCYAWEKALSSIAAQRVVGISDFEFISPIGKGASGKVFLVSDRNTGEKLALKVIDKAKIFESRSAFRHALDERLALEMVDGHPFFSRLRYAFQTRAYFYLAIDFYDGGDLYQYLRTHHGRLRESQVRAVAAEVLLALEHLHSLGFVYRDLKPENVLLDSRGHVRLADFGLCKLLPDDALTNTICGTHTYAAPEMLSVRNYGKSIDLWAYGVFVYHILRGRTPYEARDLDQVIANMNNRRIRFSSSTSQELVSMIKKLLDWNPDTRLGCGPGGMIEVRGHSFFKGLDWRRVYTRDSELPGLFSRKRISGRVLPASPGHLLRESERDGLELKDVGEDQVGLGEGHGATRARVLTSLSTVAVRSDADDTTVVTTELTLASETEGTDAPPVSPPPVPLPRSPVPLVDEMAGGLDGDMGGLLDGCGSPFDITGLFDGSRMNEHVGRGQGALTTVSENRETGASGEVTTGGTDGAPGATSGVAKPRGNRFVDDLASWVSESDRLRGRERRASRRKSGGMAMSTRLSERDVGASTKRGDDEGEKSVSLREQMVAAAEQDDLRNFDMSEWGKISVDNDHDDVDYGDGSLWPFAKSIRKLSEEERMIAGFAYCSCSTPLGLPDHL